MLPFSAQESVLACIRVAVSALVCRYYSKPISNGVMLCFCAQGDNVDEANLDDNVDEAKPDEFNNVQTIRADRYEADGVNFTLNCDHDGDPRDRIHGSFGASPPITRRNSSPRTSSSLAQPEARAPMSFSPNVTSNGRIMV